MGALFFFFTALFFLVNLFSPASPFLSFLHPPLPSLNPSFAPFASFESFSLLVPFAFFASFAVFASCPCPYHVFAWPFFGDGTVGQAICDALFRDESEELAALFEAGTLQAAPNTAAAIKAG